MVMALYVLEYIYKILALVHGYGMTFLLEELLEMEFVVAHCIMIAEPSLLDKA